MSPFDIADTIFMKTGMINPDEAGYDPFMMNRIASNNKDSVFFADALNKFPGLSKQMSYRFYYDALDKGKRYGKWHKQSKHEEIACIAKAYGVNKLRAAQYHALLGEDGIAAVIASQDKGGHVGKPVKTKATPGTRKSAKK
jgi:hypothetical protein